MTLRDPWADLTVALTALRVDRPADFDARARIFLAELRRWNPVARLTGYRSEVEQIEHLVLESALLLPVLGEGAGPLLDIGSGPGIPGLVLKLARPGWAVTLIEANRRRGNFLRHVVRHLGLTGVSVEVGRAETLATLAHLARAFRTVTMRAVAPPARALALARPFVAAEGQVIIPLGPGARPPTGPPTGEVREVRLRRPDTGLRIRRAFLIIRAPERGPSVPRETGGGSVPDAGRGQPEGRRG